MFLLYNNLSKYTAQENIPRTVVAQPGGNDSTDGQGPIRVLGG